MKLTVNSNPKEKTLGDLSIVSEGKMMAPSEANELNLKVPDYTTSIPGKKRSSRPVKVAALVVVLLLVLLAVVLGMMYHNYTQAADILPTEPDRGDIQVGDIHSLPEHFHHHGDMTHHLQAEGRRMTPDGVLTSEAYKHPHHKDFPHQRGHHPGDPQGHPPHFTNDFPHGHPHFPGQGHGPAGRGEAHIHPHIRGEGHMHPHVRGEGHPGFLDGAQHGRLHLEAGQGHVTGQGLGHVAEVTQIRCSNIHYRSKHCQVKGHIVELTLLRQISRSKCILGQSFFNHGSSIEVTQGCRALFKVHLA